MMAMDSTYLKAIAMAVAVVLTIYMLLNLGSSTTSSTSFTSPQWRQNHKSAGAIAQQIQNATLGFEKIFVLNMPERDDKRDSIVLAASLTGMELDFAEGIKGSTVLNKTLPVGQEDRKMSDTNIGSWRAHMNTIRGIVESGLSSALILEDDADWDIRLKDQVVDFAKGSQYLLNNSSTHKPHSPYGDGWDVLWLGMCHEILPEGDDRVYIIDNDQSVPQRHYLGTDDTDVMQKFPEHARIVHMVGSPYCTFAYAVSFKGAQKLLYALSVKELQGIFDNALSWWCSGHSQDSSCVSAQPPYFYQHRFAGGPGKSSDINADVPGREKGETLGIRWSTRLNVEKLIMGQKDYEDSYPDT